MMSVNTVTMLVVNFEHFQYESMGNVVRFLIQKYG